MRLAQDGRHQAVLSPAPPPTNDTTDSSIPKQHASFQVCTIESNKSNYAERDYSRAVIARKIQVLVGRPELKDFIRYIETRSLVNCPITRQDAINAHAIFGRDVGSIKGKMTRRQLKGILRSVSNNLPKSIMENYRDITLCIDCLLYTSDAADE